MALNVGDSAEVSKTITEDDVRAFAELTGDRNPVHLYEEYDLRGLGIGIYFFTVDLAAYGIGAPLIGRANDMLGATMNPSMMRYALTLCPRSSALAALLLRRGSRRLESQT